MRKVFVLIIISIFSLGGIAFGEVSSSKNTVIKNSLFSVSIPEELKGSYEIQKEKDKISIFHKKSKALGFGGFTFGVKAYKDPSEHAMMPGARKLGELKDSKGVLYDVVLKHPTDVQYDYTNGPEAPESFKQLYNLGENVSIIGIKGARYYKNQGVKGEDLYKDILKKHYIAISEKWDSSKLEAENMSYMYNVINQKDKIGYTYYDVNADGIEELLIGEITDGDWKGVIYDMYTMVNRTPKHVVSGGSRNRYYACDGSFICNEYSSGALESGVRVYILVENSTELFPQLYFKYDGYENSKNPYFIAYSDEKWDNVSEEAFKERKKVFEKYERFNYIPLINEYISSDKVVKNILNDRYNPQKDYFDYLSILSEFPKNYYYTTVKINKSKERILIITDTVTADNNSYHGLFYYCDKNGFVSPLGYLESSEPLSVSKNYLYLNVGDKNIRFYISDKSFSTISSEVTQIRENIDNIKFETIESANKFSGDFGEAAGDDVKRVNLEGFYFEYHKQQYKKQHIKGLMHECIKDGVKTQVQMYCCVVKKLHP